MPRSEGTKTRLRAHPARTPIYDRSPILSTDGRRGAGKPVSDEHEHEDEQYQDDMMTTTPIQCCRSRFLVLVWNKMLLATSLRLSASNHRHHRHHSPPLLGHYLFLTTAVCHYNCTASCTRFPLRFLPLFPPAYSETEVRTALPVTAYASLAVLLCRPFFINLDTENVAK